MASQTVSAAKRYRISLLLDAYSELLTEKQRTFLRHYFEQDLSFGEIAREYGVSRQAIFDSVKHGEEALENFERVLKLVDNGWARWVAAGRTADALAERLEAVRGRVAEAAVMGGKDEALSDLNALIADLRGDSEGDLDDELDTRAEAPAVGGNGGANV